jgi:hypothetical protein
MDDWHISRALGLEWRYGKALDTLKYDLMDRARRGRDRHEREMDTLLAEIDAEYAKDNPSEARIARLEEQHREMAYWAKDIEKQYVTGRTKPESIDRILQLTQLQPRPLAGRAGTPRGRSLLFDESVLRLSSELTLQLRSGDTRRHS